MNDNKEKNDFFNKAFNDYFDKIVRYLLCYCKDIDLAKDIAQDSFVSFWQHIDKVDYGKSPLPLLIKISKNKLLSNFEKKTVKEKYKNYIKKTELELMQSCLTSSIIDIIEENDIEKLVNKSINDMKENIKETFILSRFKNKKNKDIAKEMGISIKTVEYRISVALSIIKKNLRNYIKIAIIIIINLY